MKVSHIIVLLVALAAGLIIGAKQPGIVSTLTGGMVSGGS